MTPSAEFRRLEIIIRLDDLAQTVFQRAIATIGVRVMAFHQLLEARLDLGRRRVNLQPECVERLSLGVPYCPGLRRRPLDTGARAGSELAQHLERIAGAMPMEPV